MDKDSLLGERGNDVRMKSPGADYTYEEGSEKKSGSGSTVAQIITSIIVLIVAVTILGLTISNRKDIQTTLDNVNSQIIKQQELIASQFATPRPFKYAVPHMTPRKSQKNRGTCWNFGTMASVEHAYRLQGIKNGWLKPNQYVKLSEQAFGNQTLELCARPEYKDKCDTPTDNIVKGSTEGGETHYIWALRPEYKKRIVPWSVCPYVQSTSVPHHEDCPGFAEAMEKNPIEMEVLSFDTLYQIEDIKQTLWRKGHSLVWSFPVHVTSNYYPCIGKWNLTDDCQSRSVLCPQDSNFGVVYCHKSVQQMYTADGEFIAHHNYEQVAGHSMILAGYNDEFVSLNGFYRGGFIIRNSWDDGNVGDEFHPTIKKPRGSHTIDYYLQKISEADDRMFCPNSNSPRSWYQPEVQNETTLAADIKLPKNVKSAKANHQPLEIECYNPEGNFCETGYLYYYKSFEFVGDDTVRYSFWRLTNESHPRGDIWTVEPCTFSDIAHHFKPVEKEGNVWYNKDDFCGYYWMPYQVAAEAGTLFDGFQVNDYEFQFSESSFAANAAKYPNLDYTHIKQSTHTQKQMPEIKSQYPQGAMDVWKD